MRGIHTCCPEAPSVINITQNIIEMDGEEAFWDEQYATASSFVGRTLTLLRTPYARSTVQVIRNTGTLRQGFDFAVYGNTISLSFDPHTDDLFHVRYFALQSSTSTITGDGAFVTGMTMGYSGATAPEGWLKMDGTTAHAIVPATQALADWLIINDDYEVTPRVGTDFILKGLLTSFFHNGQLVSGSTIIKL